jgi:hypothetical protein
LAQAEIAAMLLVEREHAPAPATETLEESRGITA